MNIRKIILLTFIGIYTQQITPWSFTGLSCAQPVLTYLTATPKRIAYALINTPKFCLNITRDNKAISLLAIAAVTTMIYPKTRNMLYSLVCNIFNRTRNKAQNKTAQPITTIGLKPNQNVAATTRPVQQQPQAITPAPTSDVMTEFNKTKTKLNKAIAAFQEAKIEQEKLDQIEKISRHARTITLLAKKEPILMDSDKACIILCQAFFNKLNPITTNSMFNPIRIRTTWDILIGSLLTELSENITTCVMTEQPNERLAHIIQTASNKILDLSENNLSLKESGLLQRAPNRGLIAFCHELNDLIDASENKQVTAHMIKLAQSKTGATDKSTALF